MDSNSNTQLIFASAQTRFFKATIVLFFLTTATFMFLYSKTEINTRLSSAKSELGERLASLDNTASHLARHVLLLKNLATLYLEQPTEIEPADKNALHNIIASPINAHVAADTFITWPHNEFNGIIAGPMHEFNKNKNSREYANEFQMATQLLKIQYASHFAGEYLEQTYYYSDSYRFISSFPYAPDNQSRIPFSMKTLDELTAKFKAHTKIPEDAPQANQPFWSAPHFDKTIHKHIITSAAHVYKNATPKGTIGVDISVDIFNKFTKPFFGKQGDVFIVSENERLIVSSRHNNPENPTAPPLDFKYSLPEPIRPFSRNFLENSNTTFLFKKGYLILGGKLNVAPWHLIYVVSIKEFTLYMLPKMVVYTLSVVAAIICFILGAVVIRHRYIRPSQIAEKALKKAHDNLEIRVQQRTAELTHINEELSESKKKYKLLFTLAPVGIYELDFISGRFTSVNDVMCSYTGYTREELLSIDPYSLLTERGREIISKRLQKVFNGEEVSQNVELDIIDKNGSRFSALLNTSYVYKDNRVTGSRVVVYDISERKMAEKALKKSEERFRSLVESTSDWIWELNQKALFIYNSPSVEAITGYTPAELLGTRYFDYFPQREQERFLTNFRQAIASGTSLPTIECKIIHKTGKLLTVEARGVLSFDDKGIPTGARGICRDITEKKKIDAEKAELQKVLERAKKMEALGLLAGGVAHDLNNILSGVINYPELILLDLPEDSSIRAYVQAIYLSGKRAAAIVDDLITVARGAARTQEAINFNTIVNEYLLSADYSNLVARYPSVKIHMTPDQNLSNIKGSQVQVRKALLNLVINAVEAVRENGSVLISTQNISVETTIKGYDDIPPGDYVVLSVKDTGEGIAAEDMERIFEPFYSNKVMGRSGTGLGLAIVWNTVVDHDGHINIRSSEKGTVFDLYFPTSQSVTISKEPARHIDSYKGNGEKILVVDDEFVQREIACQLLETLWYSSVAMESGEKALEYLKKESADLILLDMMMDPGMNGRKTFEKIIEIHPNQKVIIASGFADTAELRKAQDKGAGAFLKKPYTIEELGTLIKRQLNG